MRYDSKEVYLTAYPGRPVSDSSSDFCFQIILDDGNVLFPIYCRDIVQLVYTCSIYNLEMTCRYLSNFYNNGKYPSVESGLKLFLGSVEYSETKSGQIAFINCLERSLGASEEDLTYTLKGVFNCINGTIIHISKVWSKDYLKFSAMTLILRVLMTESGCGSVDKFNLDLQEHLEDGGFDDVICEFGISLGMLMSAIDLDIARDSERDYKYSGHSSGEDIYYSQEEQGILNLLTDESIPSTISLKYSGNFIENFKG